ncbi:MAG: hypothetical protein ACYDDF_01450 [Thermoplasmatota archaeon]
MRGRLATVIVGIVTLATILSGCLNPSALLGGSTPVHRQALTNTTNSSLPSVMPDNRSGSFAAFNETNLTDMMGMHSHDYWQGRTRVQLYHGHVMLGPAQNPAFPDAYGTQVDIKAPPGMTVYEGTGTIEVAITNPKLHACDPTGDWFGGSPICTDGFGGNGLGPALPDPAPPDPQPSTNLKLQYLTAASDPNAWNDAGPITWGTPTIITIKDPKETDMPHSMGSLWVFRISSSDPKDSTLEFDVAITIVRGAGAIPLWPGHPLFYAKGHYRVVFDGTGESADTVNFDNGGAAHSSHPDKLISAGTNTLIIFANITSALEPIPPAAPTHWYLSYHNASYTNWNITPDDANHTVDKKTLEYVIKVDSWGMDTPYGTQSRWEFLVRGSTAICHGGCADYDVKYHMTIIATDLVAPHYDPTSPGF